MNINADDYNCISLPTINTISNSRKGVNLIARVLSSKRLNFKTIKSTLEYAWNQGDNFKIAPLEQNMVLCTFESEENKKKIIHTGPWNIWGAHAVLKS